MMREAGHPGPITCTLETDHALTCGQLVVLRGRARTAATSLAYVEVSTDGGATWEEATITGDNEPHSWVEWEHPWTPTRAGGQIVLTRATGAGQRGDALTGAVAPEQHLLTIG